MKHLLYLTAIAILYAVQSASGQGIVVDTSRGVVGQEGRIHWRYTGSLPVPSPLTIRGTLKLGNPTVFYPQRFIAPSGRSLSGVVLTRTNDSIYQFAITSTLESSAGQSDTLCTLAGEMLAASDSITTIQLLSVTINDSGIPDARSVMMTSSVGARLPYVRFAFLDQNYPNPVVGDAKTTFAYRIDKQSDVTFYIYDVIGREIYHVVYPSVPLGVYTFSFSPLSLGMANGEYWVRLITNSGEAFRKMGVMH